jgi:hypothetical protein
VAATLQALATPSRLLILTRLRHVAMLLDEAVYHTEHLPWESATPTGRRHHRLKRRLDGRTVD